MWKNSLRAYVRACVCTCVDKLFSSIKAEYVVLVIAGTEFILKNLILLILDLHASYLFQYMKIINFVSNSYKDRNIGVSSILTLNTILFKISERSGGG